MTAVENVPAALLGGMTPDQVATLVAARDSWADGGRTEKRLAPDGTWREVSGDAQVIPLAGLRRQVMARSGRPDGLTDEQWEAHCDALIAEVDRQAAEAAAEARRANRYASYLRRRSPKYAESSYAMLKPDQLHGGKVARWWSSPRRPRTLFLAGRSRTGKTTAGYAIANEAHASGAWVEVFTELDLARLLKDDDTGAVWDRVIGCDLLFLDDWGRARGTDWWKEILQQLLDIRQAGASLGRRLLVTANTPVDLTAAYEELVVRYGDPIPERVIDGGGILMFDGARIRQLLEDW